MFAEVTSKMRFFFFQARESPGKGNGKENGVKYRKLVQREQCDCMEEQDRVSDGVECYYGEQFIRKVAQHGGPLGCAGTESPP